MAYTFFKRKVRCWRCRQSRVALYTLHGPSGVCHGILCARDLAEYVLDSGFTAHPLGNLSKRRHRRRRGHPVVG